MKKRENERLIKGGVRIATRVGQALRMAVLAYHEAECDKCPHKPKKEE